MICVQYIGGGGGGGGGCSVHRGNTMRRSGGYLEYMKGDTMIHVGMWGSKRIKAFDLY